MKLRFAALIVLAAMPAAANPMWETGLDWSCTASAAISCERGTPCETGAATDRYHIANNDNAVRGPGRDQNRTIRRHFEIAVPGSPLGPEVKIELDTNGVMWLTQVDPSRTFSTDWHGILVEPKAGAVLSEVRLLVCTPALPHSDGP